MKTYVLIISKHFPKTHPRAVEPTNFDKAIKYYEKIHTIRGNYELWEKRIQEVQKGKAVLSIRQWTGKPYRSKQIEIERLGQRDDVGIQKLKWFWRSINFPFPSDVETLAHNDGLTLEDFKAWFKGYDLSKPMALIHFTGFRYKDRKPIC